MTNESQEFERSESNARYYCRNMPALFVKAYNALVWDAQGRSYVDFLAGCGALNYGHNHSRIKAAAVDYLLQNGIVHGLDLHTGAKAEFIRKFRQLILEPRGLSYKLQFTGPTGANAVEAALKLARKVTGRRTVACFTNAFHGMSLGALSVTGSTSARRASAPLLDGVVRLPYDGYHGAGVAEIDRFEAMVRDPSGGIEAPAAIIVETVQGEGGLNVASAPWLRRLAALAASVGALLIIDDIQTGCGRTGDFFSFERAGIAPDIVCLAKSLSGSGLPMALLLIKPELDVFAPGEHNGTFRGNNLAFVTAAAALDLWSETGLAESAALRAQTVRDWMRMTVAEFPVLGLEIKGLGMMTGLRFADAALANRVARDAFARGVLIETAGPHDEVLKIMPPLTIEANVLADGLTRVHAAIAEIAAEVRPIPAVKAA